MYSEKGCVFMADFVGSKLKNDIVVSKLYTVHYFEFSKTYKFTGERHNFWEIVYADKGEATITADNREFTLHQGEIIFHKPNEWHNICSNGVVAPIIAIVTFECNSKAMSFFENRILKAGQLQKNIISKIVSEYTNAFSTPLNDPLTYKLTRKSDCPIGAQQLLRQYICELLISYLRNPVQDGQKPQIAVNQSNLLLTKLVTYMKDNISQNISIAKLVKFSNSNKTTITNIFNENFGMGAIEYFINLKVETAKQYLRENNYNITQISEILGYSNIHYFSRQFKKVTGMSPTQYSASIQAILPIKAEET